jgi:hypothetical protein
MQRKMFRKGIIALSISGLCFLGWKTQDNLIVAALTTVTAVCGVCLIMFGIRKGSGK